MEFEQRIRRAPDDPMVLKEVDFRELGITALPEMIGELKITGNLDLWRNRLTSLPESMGSIQVGKKLDLSHNQLRSLPESMESMKAGGHLRLNNQGSQRWYEVARIR